MDKALREAVLRAGGLRALGRKLGIAYQAIAKWEKCPPLRALEIERLTGVSRRSLRPDLYSERSDELEIQSYVFGASQVRARSVVSATGEVRAVQGNFLPPSPSQRSTARKWIGLAETNEDIAEPQMTDSHTANVHLAGELFVAAELVKRGYAVSLTLGNAKAIDLYAERGGRSVAVEVKARRDGSGWAMPSEDSKIIDRVPYVLVKLNKLDEPVEYFILTPEQVRAGTKRYGTPPRATIYMAQAKQGLGAWHVIEDAIKG
jgi:DNA-binding transcriptional regulator YdaS (Cro superfamily)